MFILEIEVVDVYYDVELFVLICWCIVDCFVEVVFELVFGFVVGDCVYVVFDDGYGC